MILSIISNRRKLFRFKQLPQEHVNANRSRSRLIAFILNLHSVTASTGWCVHIYIYTPLFLVQRTIFFSFFFSFVHFSPIHSLAHRITCSIQKAFRSSILGISISVYALCHTEKSYAFVNIFYFPVSQVHTHNSFMIPSYESAMLNNTKITPNRKQKKKLKFGSSRSIAFLFFLSLSLSLSKI